MIRCYGLDRAPVMSRSQRTIFHDIDIRAIVTASSGLEEENESHGPEHPETKEKWKTHHSAVREEQPGSTVPYYR